jgi:hypothetical protein
MTSSSEVVLAHGTLCVGTSASYNDTKKMVNNSVFVDLITHVLVHCAWAVICKQKDIFHWESAHTFIYLDTPSLPNCLKFLQLYVILLLVQIFFHISRILVPTHISRIIVHCAWAVISRQKDKFQWEPAHTFIYVDTPNILNCVNFPQL